MEAKNINLIIYELTKNNNAIKGLAINKYSMKSNNYYKVSN